MRIFKISDVRSQISGNKLLHLFRKGTGITDRRALVDTGSKSDRISAAFDQFTCPQDCFLPGQPPQFIKPMISISSLTSAKAPVFSRTALKSAVPGQ